METILHDRYKILNQLGSGGFGETFLAEDLQTSASTQVVIKSLKAVHNQATTEITEKLFSKEASVLKDLGSDCSQIPTLFDYFSEDDRYYLVQEYIEGKNLTQMGVISSEQCLSILSSLLDTLKYIHGKNIIHRDIKPENIIIRESDRLPVLIDFGAVKETMGTMTTSTGSNVSSVLVGTKAFMAPEQSTGRTVFSSDLYSLALTMIYALTGKLPTEIPANNITGELDWQKLVTNLDPVLDQVLSKASKMDIPSRYPTAMEMLDVLKSASLSQSITLTKGIPSTKKKTTEKPSVNPIPSATETTPVITTPIEITNSDVPNQPSAQSNNLMAIVLTSVLVALGVSGGFWLVQRANQAQQEQERLERLLAEEAQKRAEEAEKRAKAERERAEEAEKRAEAERKRAEVESRSQRTVIVPVQPSSNYTNENTSRISKTNAKVGGQTLTKNIRSGAGTDYPVIGKVYRGDPIQIIDSSRDRGNYLWYKVYHPQSDTTGWIAEQLVNFN